MKPSERIKQLANRYGWSLSQATMRFLDEEPCFYVDSRGDLSNRIRPDGPALLKERGVLVRGSSVLWHGRNGVAVAVRQEMETGEDRDLRPLLSKLVDAALVFAKEHDIVLRHIEVGSEIVLLHPMNTDGRYEATIVLEVAR